jgi:uncharacterized SAM-binding protein YcdF (DUF218 family)
MDTMIDEAVATLWDYMQLGQTREAVDVMVVLGSRDDRVASYAAGLLRRGIAPRCLVSGGAAQANDLLVASWREGTEAEHFVNVMKATGIGTGKVLIEDRSTNTGENARFSYGALKAVEIPVRSLLIVTKPYMERRALATFEAQWPNKATKLHVTSQGGSIEQYCNEQHPYEDVVNIMLGDFQRIIEYPKLGYQSKQPVTTELLGAFEALKLAGFTKHLL